MNFDPALLRRYAPLALPLAIVVFGWMFLIGPTASANAREAEAIDQLQQRLAQVRASLAEPPPPAIAGDPAATLARRVAARDASSQVLEELARLASRAPALNLLIETGDRVALSPGAPQPAGDVEPDPRFGLFELPLAYSPISMSFDAEFARVGDLLWDLRDLATTVEIRSIAIAPRASGDDEVVGNDGLVHVSLTLFAYAQQTAPVATTGVAR